MIYKLILTKKAKNDFISLEKKVQKKIANKLRFFIAGNHPMKYAKKLKDNRLGSYRFRIGDYRTIFDVDKNGNIHLLIILRVKHRKEIYE